jgi:L-lysine exporter family protein LysE/ArgO
VAIAAVAGLIVFAVLRFVTLDATTADPSFALPSGFLAGFTLGAGFAASVGPQNLVLIRAGLMQQHLLSVTATGLVSELMLLVISVLTSGIIVAGLGSVRPLAVGLGATFLLWCGVRTLTQHNPHGLDHLPSRLETLTQAISTILAVTWCNPLGYLKWAIFAGVLLAQPSQAERNWCIAGLVVASFLKFMLWPLAGRLLGQALRHPNATVWFNRVSGMALMVSAVFTYGQM